LAHAHLETRLKSNEDKLIKGEKEREAQKKQIAQMKSENEELKERIRAGAKEYSKLFEKYRLLKNQQFNTDMNVYHDLNGEMHITRRHNPFGCNTFTRQDSSQQQDLIRYTHRHSTPSSDGLESDSAIQVRPLINIY
jgi:predicted nuclease with TOPRIM domain